MVPPWTICNCTSMDPDSEIAPTTHSLRARPAKLRAQFHSGMTCKGEEGVVTPFTPSRQPSGSGQPVKPCAQPLQVLLCIVVL